MGTSKLLGKPGIPSIGVAVLLGPVYMEKSCPGQEHHPPTRVNSSERLYEKKVEPFARVKGWLSNDNSARACSDCLALTELTRPKWRKVGLARRVTQPSKEGDPARRVTLLAEPTFCFLCKWFVKFCQEM